MQDYGSRPRERQEDGKSHRQRSSMPTGSVTHYGYSVPLVRVLFYLGVPCVSALLADFWPQIFFFSVSVGVECLPSFLQDALPSFPETLAEELRTSLRKFITDPAYFMERCVIGILRLV